MTPLETEVDKLITWIETNAADHTDVREALSAAGLRLGARADQANLDVRQAVKTARDAELVKNGKTKIVPDPVGPGALIDVAEAAEAAELKP